jgi:hypothetical protein
VSKVAEAQVSRCLILLCSAAGWVCVGKYNPEGKAAVDALGPKGGKGKGKGIFGRITEGVLAVEPVSIAVQPRTLVERQLGGRGGFSGACKPNILIYAKGTTESGEFGGTVGPGLKTAMGKQGGGQWTVVGVNYTANSDGNNCVGLPGGMVAKGILESASQKCPNSKIFLSGYSQGAMVVRNAVAYANAKARSQVKVSDELYPVLQKSKQANLLTRVSSHTVIHSTVPQSRGGVVLS